MKKILTFLTLLTLFTTTSWAADPLSDTWDASSGALGTAIASVGGTATGTISTLNENSWSYTRTLVSVKSGKKDYIAYNSTTGAIQLGSSNAQESLEFNTNSYGTAIIKSVSVECSSAGNHSLSISVGGSTYLSTSTPSGSTVSVVTGTGSSSGEIVISFNPSSYGALYIKSISVTYEEGGSQTTVATPVITLYPASGPYYVGDEVTATITCAEEGATIYYTTDNTAPTTTSATIENGGTLTITSDCTIKAFAVKADMDDSEIAEKEVSFTSISTANTVAQILALEGGTKFKFTGNLVVSGKSGNQLYAQDETGGIHFYGSTPNYTFGDVIPAGFIATFVADYNGAPELTTMERMAEATTHGEQLDAATLTPSQITANNENAFIYAVIKNATISGTTITANGETVTVQTTFSNDLPTDGKSYDFYGITNWNYGGKFMILSYEETYIDPGEGYYLVGNFSGWKRYENYKFTEAEGSLVLNNVTLPDNAEFKIVNKTSSSEIWYGGQTDNTDKAKLYVLHGEWHTDIPLTNSENNNYVKNFSIAAGGVTSFTFNTSTMKFDALRAAQVYFTCDKINNWAKEAMTATDNGWTITKQLEEGAKFAFIDEWGGHHGNDWAIKPEHYGDNYDIPLGNANTPTMQDAGYYKLDVNSALTVMHVNKEFAINCSADPNGGGNVTAKVGGVTVTSAMAGETVTIEYTTANGYTFNNITLNGNALDAVDGVYSFTMPNADANVVANFTAQSFAITVVSPNGTTTCPATATTSSTVSFTVTPDEGYTVTNVTASFVNGENTGTVDVSYNEETGKYSFGMPPFPVTVTVAYKQQASAGDWKLVTGDEMLQAGYEYIIVCQDVTNGNNHFGPWAMTNDNAGTTTAQSNARKATDNIILGDQYLTAEPGDDVAIFKLEGSKDAWKLHGTSGYLYGTEDKNYLNVSENVEDNWDLMSIAIEGSVAKITCNAEEGTNKRWIQCNNNSITATNGNKPYFSRYSSNQKAVCLYYREAETPATEITLAGLVALGADANGKKYCINEDLLGVKKSADGKTIWFKDDNKFANPDVCNSTDNNFEMSANGKVWHSKDASFDQSNWIEVVFPSEVNYDENYAKNLTGVYSYNGGNPKLTVTTTDGIEETLYEGTISTNSYMPANFAGSQQGHYTNNGSQVECTYFFVTPKPQEVAKIFYAVYSNGALTMPSNTNGVSGTVTVDMSKNATTFEPENDKVYSNFDVIICIDASSAPAPAPQGAPMLKAQGDNYKVYPVNLTAENDVTTAISTVGVNGEVKSVKYVSVAGVVSDRPFQGVNIVVTEYTDGSRTTAKVVK